MESKTSTETQNLLSPVGTTINKVLKECMNEYKRLEFEASTDSAFIQSSESDREDMGYLNVAGLQNHPTDLASKAGNILRSKKLSNPTTRDKLQKALVPDRNNFRCFTNNRGHYVRATI